MAEGPDHHPGKFKPLGLFSNTGPDPLENQKLPSQHFILGNNRPPAFCCWADDGPLKVVF